MLRASAVASVSAVTFHNNARRASCHTESGPPQAGNGHTVVTATWNHKQEQGRLGMEDKVRKYNSGNNVCMETVYIGRRQA